MNTRLFAVLFAALFLIGAFPILFVQPSGSASAGVMAGFTVPIENLYHVAISIAIGLLSAWAGNETILVLPLGTLLMLVIGSLTKIQEQSYPAVHYFLFGAIILFSLCVSILRSRAFIFTTAPIMAWAYFSGNSFMHSIPSITTPLFFMMGIIISNVLILAIGVALGITLSYRGQKVKNRLKSSAAFAAFMSMF